MIHSNSLSRCLDQKEKLTLQRQKLNKRLGLDIAGGMGMETDLFSDEDLMMKQENRQQGTKQESSQEAVAEVVQQLMVFSNPQMSAREKNRAKRKAKQLAKQRSKDVSETPQSNGAEDGEPSNKMRKTLVMDEGKPAADSKPDNTMDFDENEEWPFESFCELLLADLFSTSWEVRHGAATGLREVIKLHGKGAGKMVDISADQMTTANQLWLEDVALRLLCVMALDRFGDFVSDEVVAPVRETCAQTLGTTLHYMEVESVQGVLHILMQLLGQRQWEVRHGGLLGLKYLLAVRQDMTGKLLPLVLPVIMNGLQDSVDDVCSVAAASLIPVADTLVKVLPRQVPTIISCLWDTLLDLDDLTASTNSIMTLLSTLLARPQAGESESTNLSLSELVPRLWPFLRHNITSVRKCVLTTLHILLTSERQPHATWLIPILQEALRHVYQRVLLEEKAELLDLIQQVWCSVLEKSPLDYLIAATSPFLGTWLCMMMQPSRLPFDQNFLIDAKHKDKSLTPGKSRSFSEVPSPVHDKLDKEYIAGTFSLSDTQANRDACVMRARITAGRMLGILCSYLTKPVPNYPENMETPSDALLKLLLFHLNSKSALQRMAIGQIVMVWASQEQENKCPEMVKEKIMMCLNEAVYFDEIAMLFTRMQTECRDFVASLKQQKINMDSFIQPGTILTIDQAQALATTTFDAVKGNLKPKQLQEFEQRRGHLLTSITQTSSELQTLTIRVQSSLAGATILLHFLPEKLNPVIRPLMDIIKKEDNPDIQRQAAANLSQLLSQCITRNPCPNGKVVKNLCVWVCSDPTFTPGISQPVMAKYVPDPNDKTVPCDMYSGIVTLTKQQKGMEKIGRRPGRRPANVPVEISPEMVAEINEAQRQLFIQRRGATFAITTIAENMASDLPNKVPTLWDNTIKPISVINESGLDASSLGSDENTAQELLHSLQVMEMVGPSLHRQLQAQILQKLPALTVCLQHPFTALRHMAARCLGMLSKLDTVETMNYVLEHVLSLLGSTDSEVCRGGAIEALTHIIDSLGVDIVAYIVLMVVPILGCMSDLNEAVRLMATYCFATLIRLMPLESGIPDPPEMKSSLVKQKEKERKFLEQLLDSSKVEDYVCPVPIKAELRKYQQDGINWLAFLNTYKLHGILCDDMGLGKTLMSICILAGDHYDREQRYKQTQAADSVPMPSIVVCPPTLTGHWVYEVEKFVSKEYLNPLHYTGPVMERVKLRSKVKKHNLIVVSYDIVRNDIEFFGAIKWNYCILDEGHIIKNGKTKISKSVKQLVCNHRLILSGTPIQNNVLELWSLFDFLMPGFLGTEKQFTAKYGRPILQSRDAKSSSKEQEAGALAMEALHRQVLPFLLRRLKEDVLQDLPPKIIQDYYCDLSPLQVQLYEDFAKSRAKKNVESDIEEGDGKSSAHSHIFQALQYLRKVCNHPALVLTPQHPEYNKVMAQLMMEKTTLKDIQHAAKLTALRQLLTDCGIGVGADSNASDAPVVNQHRVLVFCQLKSMLDMVEKDLLLAHMPNVTYLRLDGSVPAGSRHGLVNRFNNDPSIDILLLTTHVGGLGLNLTGADTVIFVEHDWNPMKDLQAMDRAHRIGQKKVVNVYRLITRGTLEEKIMGLQKFKLTIANTVISQENSSLVSMGTDQLLDLFTLDDSKKGTPSEAKPEHGKESMKSILENMDELWDEKQYETEYDLGSFMQSLAQ
ncbi:TATA-binding protein-associated factor 172-like [Lingula anatina]|uniref:TATA-binding protein-associated factor 172-like n=1 Tax=Lingula anatina TaxID=7574 RepID=A0A1S3HME5_LINAN|nr:TATA-binding protein-associated factor 172-like [Lingula anatina]|eukprot:XP_013387250.1 TATA-binding protein-associated factor 172-like [Lingula anatina]